MGKIYKWIRCPWCGKHYPKSALVLTEEMQNRLKCTCGYWTEFLDGGLICTTGNMKNNKDKCGRFTSHGRTE